MLTFEKANELGSKRHPNEWLRCTMSVVEYLPIHENKELVANVILRVLDAIRLEERQQLEA